MMNIHSLNYIFKRPTILLLIISTGISLSSGCQKDDDPFANKVPTIELLSLTPQMVVEFNDSLVFNIKYRDNDGDLGENNPSVKNLFITDNRIGIVYDYRIQQLAPTGSAIAIEGTLQVVLNSVARTDTSLAQESATFSVYVKDRAGNKSNVVTSGAIIIKEP
ncbi:MAG: hypothetical protein ACKVQV_05135 [Bacteroidia bacterium]